MFPNSIYLNLRLFQLRLFDIFLNKTKHTRITILIYFLLPIPRLIMLSKSDLLVHPSCTFINLNILLFETKNSSHPFHKHKTSSLLFRGRRAAKNLFLEFQKIYNVKIIPFYASKTKGSFLEFIRLFFGVENYSQNDHIARN